MQYHPDNNRRRTVLACAALPAWPLLHGCAAPLPLSLNAATTPAARAMLEESAAAHGGAALAKIDDLSLRYEGEWRALINRLQPALADAGFRGGSEERLLLRDGLTAQTHTGPSGRKQVVRRTASQAQGEVRVWFNGEEAQDTDRRAAAALVVDGYSLFLLGPMLLASTWSTQRTLVLELGSVEPVNEHVCDVLHVRVAPGFGFSPAERLALFIDRKERLMRRVRFTLDGLASTVGAIAEVEAFDHVTLHGVRWPTRFYERLLRPLPLPVHDWRLTGLDVNRGLDAGELSGPVFGGKAIPPAMALRAQGTASRR
jgi:hypothetical protein